MYEFWTLKKTTVLFYPETKELKHKTFRLSGFCENHTKKHDTPYPLLRAEIISALGLNPLFCANYRLGLPVETLIETLSVPYFYEEEEWDFVHFESRISASCLKSSRIRVMVKTPSGTVVSTRELCPLQKSQRVAFPIASWRSGTCSLTAQLFTGSLLIASGTLAIRKRPWPFTKNR